MKVNANWVCDQCENENFPNRMACNRCGKDKAKPTTTAKDIKAHAKDTSMDKVEPTTAAKETKTPAKDTSMWLCLKCNNSNYASRMVCNRCNSSKDAKDGEKDNVTATSSPVGYGKTNLDSKTKREPALIKKREKNIDKDHHKKWAVQASEEKIEENKRLLGLLVNGPSLEDIETDLTPAEIERCRVLAERKLRKQTKKEQQGKWRNLKKRYSTSTGKKAPPAESNTEKDLRSSG